MKKLFLLVVILLMVFCNFSSISAQDLNAEMLATSDQFEPYENSFSVNNYISGAIKKDGSLWMWGSNSYNALGVGPYEKIEESIYPLQVLENVKDVNLGIHVSAAIKKDGSLWMWGKNDHYDLGLGNNDDCPFPTKVTDNVKKHYFYRGSLSTIIKNDDSLWQWGLDNLNPHVVSNSKTPVKVLDNVEDYTFSKSTYDTYLYHAAIKKDHTLWIWGPQFDEITGENGIKSSAEPVKIMDNVKQVVLEQDHSAILKTDGSLYLWGSNLYGQSSIDSYGKFPYPHKVLDNVKEVGLGEGVTTVLMNDDTLWNWGKGRIGQLGNGSKKEERAPYKVLSNVEKFYPGFNFTAAIKKDGTLWTWGYNTNPPLGVNNLDPIYNPVNVLSDVTEVKFSHYHALAVRNDGSLWEWGFNNNGCLGNQNGDRQLLPFILMSDIARGDEPSTPEETKPVNPTPSDPDPVDPTPSDPEPENPTPSEPKPENPQPSTTIIYKVYNPNSGEHLFTQAKPEVDNLSAQGWRDEGVAWNSPSTGTPVYRVYNGIEHLYTSDKGEADILTTQYNWKWDYNGDPVFYSGGNTPIYRVYNPNNGMHHLTTSIVEYDSLGNLGWNKEGAKLYCTN